jgi:hypothetical protein
MNILTSTGLKQPPDLDKNVAITTAIPERVRLEIKEKKLHYNELIIRGLESVNKNPAILERLNDLESGNQKLQRKLSEFYNKLVELKADKK